MNTELLEQIGLTKSEIHVYLALLELGSTTTGKIIDKSRASSSKIYEILDRLIQKGLVSYIIQSGVKYFEAAPPNRILDYLKEKKLNIEKQETEINNLLPELELKQKLAKYKSEATIYKGMKGMETAFYAALDLLTSKDEVLVIGIPKRSKEVNRFFLKFGNERAKRKIRLKAIINEGARGEPQTQSKYSEVKYTPEVTPAAINIFNNRVIINPESKEQLIIVIDNKEVADSFRSQFNLWWNQDVFTYKGIEGMRTAFFDALESTKPGETTYVYGASVASVQSEKFFLEYNKKRALKNVKLKIIFNEEAKKKRPLASINETNPYADIRFVPQKSTPTVYEIFPDRVLISTVSKTDPVTIVVKNKDFVETTKTYFFDLWDQSRG